MKKLFYSTFIFAALLTSCGGGEEDSKEENEETTESNEATDHTDAGNAESTDELLSTVSSKGNWSTADKEKADAAVAAIDAELAVFGDKKQDFIDCYLEKVENNYSSFAAADKDLDGCSALAESCATEVMSM
ncbi:hypothetical protein [Parvicella tangerina]|uniref:Lipoprotein n=1 Tax=Parvicella tangerina TaxID=2829795 RepID=A0A916JM80_9FLAO|nr:hypothetical protein [Parvicella tangerina]CAG5081083.1 hypothetical protein CRYO30217_01532 [Parvicella tangerina]